MKRFERELATRKITFERTKDGRYRIGEMLVSTDNLARDVAAHPTEASTRIAAFVDRVLAPRDETLSWAQARKHVFWSAEPSNQRFGDALHERVTDTVSRVLVVTDAEEHLLTWVSATRWKKVKASELRATASKNLDTLLRGKKLEVEQVAGAKLGMVPVASVFKASVIFAPRFKAFVKPLGWPVVVTIPCRDFIYVIADVDRELLGRMGTVVQREFRKSSYPITTEVLRVSNDGIEAIGRFPP